MSGPNIHKIVLNTFMCADTLVFLLNLLAQAPTRCTSIVHMLRWHTPCAGSRSVAALPQGARNHWRRQRSKLALDMGALLEHVQPLDEVRPRLHLRLCRGLPVLQPAVMLSASCIRSR